MKYNCLNIMKWTEAQLKYTYDVSLQEATPQELHEALGQAVMMSISENWSRSKRTRTEECYLISHYTRNNLFKQGVMCAS